MHKALETLQFQTNQNIYEYILRNLPVDNNEQYSYECWVKKESNRSERNELSQVIKNTNKKIARAKKKTVLTNLKQLKIIAIEFLQEGY